MSWEAYGGASDFCGHKHATQDGAMRCAETTRRAAVVDLDTITAWEFKALNCEALRDGRGDGRPVEVVQVTACRWRFMVREKHGTDEGWYVWHTVAGQEFVGTYAEALVEADAWARPADSFQCVPVPVRERGKVRAKR